MDSREGPSRVPRGFPTAGPLPEAALPAAVGTGTPAKITLNKAFLDVFRVFCKAPNKENAGTLQNRKEETTSTWPRGGDHVGICEACSQKANHITNERVDLPPSASVS